MANLIAVAPLDGLFRRDLVVMRAGVIPYAEEDGETFWLMGQNARGGYLDDFGGGCKTSQKESAYACLIRETDEESSSVLTNLVRRGIDDEEGVLVLRARSRKDPPIYRYLAFVPIPYDDSYAAEFRPNKEVSALRWIRQVDAVDLRVNISTPLRPFVRYFGQLCAALETGQV